MFNFLTVEKHPISENIYKAVSNISLHTDAVLI